MSYLLEFLGLMAVFAVVIVTPGADTAMVIRQSLVNGRRAAVATSIGVGVSLMFHLSYTILGLGLIVSQSLLVFNLLKWFGAAYLVFLGWQALRAKPVQLVLDDALPERDRTTLLRSFGLGFVTNALNPKPVLFFVSLFSSLVSRDTPTMVVMFYGLGMALALVAWLALVARMLTVPNVRNQFARFGQWINRISGAVFIALGVKLASSNP